MANVIIRRKDTGAEASVDLAAFQKHYPDVPFDVIGEESDASFALVGVPEPKAPRRSPTAKRSAKARAKAQVQRVRAEAEAAAAPKPADVISPPQIEGEPA